MFTYLLEAEATIGAETFARVQDTLAASPSPEVANVNELPPDQKRALIKAEMARRRRAAGRGR